MNHTPFDLENAEAAAAVSGEGTPATHGPWVAVLVQDGKEDDHAANDVSAAETGDSGGGDGGGCGRDIIRNSFAYGGKPRPTLSLPAAAKRLSTRLVSKSTAAITSEALLAAVARATTPSGGTEQPQQPSVHEFQHSRELGLVTSWPTAPRL